MKNPLPTISTKEIYKNQWIRLREDKTSRPDGGKGIYTVIETNDSVIVGVLNDKNEIYLIHSFSYPAQKWHWELPGGGDDGESVLEASKRELAEETGIIAKEWTQLGKTRVCDGLMTEKMAILLARDITLGKRIPSDDTGLIDDAKFTNIEEVHELIKNGEMDEGQSITALYFIERWIRENKDIN